MEQRRRWKRREREGRHRQERQCGAAVVWRPLHLSLSLSLCMPRREREGGGRPSSASVPPLFFACGQHPPLAPPAVFSPSLSCARARPSASAVLFRRRPRRPSAFVRTGREAGGGRLRQIGRGRGGGGGGRLYFLWVPPARRPSSRRRFLETLGSWRDVESTPTNDHRSAMHAPAAGRVEAVCFPPEINFTVAEKWRGTHAHARTHAHTYARAYVARGRAEVEERRRELTCTAGPSFAPSALRRGCRAVHGRGRAAIAVVVAVGRSVGRRISDHKGVKAVKRVTQKCLI